MSGRYSAGHFLLAAKGDGGVLCKRGGYVVLPERKAAWVGEKIRQKMSADFLIGKIRRAVSDGLREAFCANDSEAPLLVFKFRDIP